MKLARAKRKVDNVGDGRNEDLRTGFEKPDRNRIRITLFGQLDRILEISDSDTGRKMLKSGGAVGGQGKCGERMAELLPSEIRSLDILSVKEPNLSASGMTEVTEGKSDGDLR